ncbi:MAG: putative hypoxanthine-guanine phosphoribosyltransferase [Dehalococcoidia bacterium]|nr:putative hypoxanthine-guanine phosphoribosyltransferase [Dehalococcoidia bacterium]
MIEQSTAFQHAIYEVARAVNSTLSVKEVLDALVRSATEATQAKACSLFLLSPDGKELLRSAYYGLSQEYIHHRGPLRADKSLAEALEGNPVAVADAVRDPRVQFREDARREGIASILSVPVYLKDEVIGVMRLYTGESHDFTDEEVAFAGSIANLGAIAIENAKLYESMKSSYDEIRRGIMSWYDILLDKPRPVAFAHPSEAEFARILDYHQIPWLYEPRSFPIRWEGEQVMEMFTPDFFMPTLDLYVELTTMRQSLVTEKNRKARLLRERYPEVNIRLLYRNVLFSAYEIEERVNELGARITQDYEGRRPVLVGVLKGVTCFMADLMRHISLPVTIDFMAVSPYESEAPGVVAIVKDLQISITGRDVIMVEDVVDTGLTLNYLLGYLSSRHPASLKVCTLLDKKARRLADVPVDYVGFEVPDEFVVGYGLDFREEYRNLPFIAALKPEDGR